MTEQHDVPAPAPSSGGPAPDTVPILLSADAPTWPISLPETTADGLTLPAHRAAVDRALDRHVPAEWHSIVRPAIPLVVALVRLGLDICEEMHLGKHTP